MHTPIFSIYNVYEDTTLISQQASVQKSHFYVYIPPINNNIFEIILLVITFSNRKKYNMKDSF